MVEVLVAPIAMLTGRLSLAVQIPAVVAIIAALWVTRHTYQTRTPPVQPLLWLVVVVGGATVVSYALSPVFQLKYLAVAAPAVAIVIGDAVDRAETRLATVLAVVIVGSQARTWLLFDQSAWIALRVIA